MKSAGGPVLSAAVSTGVAGTAPSAAADAMDAIAQDSVGVADANERGPDVNVRTVSAAAQKVASVRGFGNRNNFRKDMNGIRSVRLVLFGLV